MSQTLYAALAGQASTSDLYTVDPADASMTSIGPIGFAISGLAFHPMTGDLYGVTSANDAGAGGDPSLILIDTTTGAGTLIGSLGVANHFDTLHDIAFAPDGTLWGWSASLRNFGTVDITTGLYTVQSGSFSDFPGGAFGFDSAGTFWHVGNWNTNITTIDPITLDETVISSTSDGNYAHSGKFDEFDVFWASWPGGTGHGSDNLVTVDVNTGAVTVIGAFSVPGVGGLAWGGPATPVLKADFSADSRFGPATLTVNFTDHSTAGPSGPITAWDWDFGDGSSHSHVQNPTHAYTTPGVYTVVLQVDGTPPDGTAVKTRVHYIVVGGDFALYAALAGTHGTSDLYTVDPSTAVMTSVGPIGFAVTGLAQDPTTGVLYGSTSHRSSASPQSLIVIDVASGAGTLVGAYGRGTGHTAHDIAFDTNGQLWGWDSASGALWKINKATGAATVVGSAANTYGGGLDFDSIGRLWKVGYNPEDIGTVNTTNAVITFVENTIPNQQLHSGKFDQAGTFWASDNGASGAAGLNLVTVDISTGDVTVIGAFTVSGVGGLAWVSPVSEPPDFTISLNPSSINVAPNIDTQTNIHTHQLRGDTETITLSYSAPAGITVTFPTNPITAGGDAVALVHVGAVGVPGTYTVTIHAVGTSNSHDVVLTLNASAEPPGIHIAS